MCKGSNLDWKLVYLYLRMWVEPGLNPDYKLHVNSWSSIWEPGNGTGVTWESGNDTGSLGMTLGALDQHWGHLGVTLGAWDRHWGHLGVRE